MRQHVRSKSILLGLVLVAALASEAAAQSFSRTARGQTEELTKNGTNCLEVSSGLLIDVLEGRNPSLDRIKDDGDCAGEILYGRPASEVFSTSGSQNIPVVGHAALYASRNLLEDRVWWNDYLSIQSHLPVGFMGNELFSPVYGAQTVAAIMSALAKARERGHTDVAGEAEQWLKAYWALSALASQEGNIDEAYTTVRTGTFASETNASEMDGATHGTAGSRAFTTLGAAATSTNHPLLTMALDIPPKRYTNRLDVSLAFYGAIRVAAFLGGFSFTSSYEIANFNGHSAPAAVFGLTNAERSALANVVRGQLGASLNTAVSLVGSYRPQCNMSFLRTSEGTISWFGTSDAGAAGEQEICSRSKGPVFAARIDNADRAFYLQPALESEPPHQAHWKSFRDGNRICANVDAAWAQGQSANDPSYLTGPWCIDLPGGSVDYELEWTRDGGLSFVTGGSPQPRIRVQVDFVGPMTHGGTLPFGTATPAAAQTVERVVRIFNDGQATLNVSAALTNTAGNGFSLITLPAASIPSGTDSAFRVAMSRAQQGSFQAQLSITHNGTNSVSPFTLALTGTVATAQLPQGTFDVADCSFLAGWARDADNPDPIQVEIYKGQGSGAVLIETVLAEAFRGDLPFPDQDHGFTIPTPGALKTGQAETVSASAVDIDVDGKPTGNRQALNLSPKSVTCSASTTPPAAPSSLVAADGTSSSDVGLTWSGVGSASSYKVYRNTSANPATAAVVASGVAAPTFSDGSASPGVIYTYWVKATNGGGDSPLSNADTGYTASTALVSDYFGNSSPNRDPGDPLNGVAAEVGGVVWAATPGFGFGAGTLTNATADVSHIATVPFVPANNRRVFAVEAKVNVQSSEWIGVGFTKTATGAFWAQGQVWVFLRPNGLLQVKANGTVHSLYQNWPASFLTGMNHLKLTWDRIDNTVQVFLNGSAIPLTVSDLDDVAFLPAISYAGVHAFKGTGYAVGAAVVDDFRISGGAVISALQVVNVAAGADTWIAEELPNASYLAPDRLRVRFNAGLGRRSFLNYQVPHGAGTIVAARLIVRAMTPVQEIGIYRMNAMPGLGTITWANHLNSPITFTYMRSFTSFGAGATYAIDVTPFVVEGASFTVGLASGSNADAQELYSNATAQSAPYLQLTYKP